jgi:DNA cross-link repair 1A protein
MVKRSYSRSTGENNCSLHSIPYKKHVKGTPFVVDAFSFGSIPGIHGYFLSHFHSDHYMGLSKSFQHGPIFCSTITAHLASKVLRVQNTWLFPLPLETPTIIWRNGQLVDASHRDLVPIESRSIGMEVIQDLNETRTITVTLLPANHCPGSVMFLFEMKHESSDTQTKYILHTGDFRCDETILSHDFLAPYRRDSTLSSSKWLDIVYLDTTYNSPEWCFPSQKDILDQCCAYMKRLIIAENNRKLSPFQYLIMIGSYTIGKERIAIRLAESLQCKIYCAPFKQSIFECYTDPEWTRLLNLLEASPLNAIIHIVPMDWLEERKLSEMLSLYQSAFTHLIAIRPTGWTTSSKSSIQENTSNKNSASKGSGAEAIGPFTKIRSLLFHHNDKNRNPLIKKDRIYLYELPYSEHSSYSELESFKDTFRIREIIPTV